MSIPKPLLWWCVFSFCSAATAAPAGTAFNYEGRLTENGQPANGFYELRFGVYDAAVRGSLQGPLLTNQAIVQAGVFHLELDFGPEAFQGEARWLEIGARTNQSSQDFVTLSPRQPVSPTPYALHSLQADRLAGPQAVTQFLTQLAQEPPSAVSQLDPNDALLVLTQGGTSTTQVRQFTVSNLSVSMFGGGKTIHVDSTRGNDATAVRGNPARPWASITNAVAAVEDGDTVLIHPGRYLLTGGRPAACQSPTNIAAVNLLSRSNVGIIGVGLPTLYWTNYGDALNICACDNVRLSGLVFEGTRFEQGGIVASNGGSGAITLREKSCNITIDHCKFFNIPNQAITSGSSRTTTNVIVTECQFYLVGFTFGMPDLGYDGACISGIGSHWIIANNIFDRCLRGVEIENVSWVHPSLRNILVHGNQFRRIWFEAVVIAPNPDPESGAADVTISNNSFYEPESAFEFGSYCVVAYGGHRLKISGNRMSGGSGYMYGIYLHARCDITDCMVTDNFIEGGSKFGIAMVASNSGGVPGRLTNCLVSGNYCLGQGTAGVYVSAQGCRVANNYLVGAGGSDPDHGGGIVLTNEESVCTGNSIFQNFIQPHPSCKNAINLDGASVTNNYVAGNFLAGESQASTLPATAGLNTMGANWGGSGDLGGANNVKTVANDYVLAPGDRTLLVNAANVTLTLPTAAGNTDHKYIIKQIAPGASLITNATGAQTIDGVLSTNLTGQNRVIALQSDGANWQILWSQ